MIRPCVASFRVVTQRATDRPSCRRDVRASLDNGTEEHSVFWPRLGASLLIRIVQFLLDYLRYPL